MKDLKALLKDKTLFKNFRFEVIDEITKRVNSDRISAGYKPLTKRFYAVKINTSCPSYDDLGFLLKRVQQSAYPAKTFFGSLKVK